MTMKLWFYGLNLNGTTAELFRVEPDSNGDLAAQLLERAPVTEGAVAFTPTAPPPSFAIRIGDPTVTFARTGGRGPESGFIEAGTGEWRSAYWAVEADPSPVVTQDYINSHPPEFPQTFPLPENRGSVRIENMLVGVEDIRIVATGDANYLGPLRRAVPLPFRYRYEFRLAPNNDPLHVEWLLNVETIHVELQGPNVPVLHEVVSFILGIIVAFFRDEITSGIQNQVEGEVREMVAAQLSADSNLQDVIVTIEGITLSAAEGIVLRAAGTLNANKTCASVPTSGAARPLPIPPRPRPRAQMNKLRLMRDAVLKGTPRGDGYLRLLKKHNAELVQLLLMHPDLLRQADKVIRLGLKDYDLNAPERGVLSPATAQEGVALLEMVQKAGSKKLAAAIRPLIPEVRDYVGRPVGKALKK